MFTQAPEWISRSPLLRKTIVKVWRALLRLQRATRAQAVIVVRRNGCVLAAAAGSGELRLPSIELDGWEPVGTQVQRLAERMLRQPSAVELHAIDGTPGKEGVTFLYLAEVGELRETVGSWLDAEGAASALGDTDRRLLRIMNRRD